VLSSAENALDSNFGNFLPQNIEMIRYWITEEKEGQGIITRCVEALMNDACANTDVTRFVIGCARENTRSRAVPERLGYRVYVTVPQGEKVGEFTYDRVVYGMKANDWRKRPLAPSSPLQETPL
jgi:ribosomal-protein-serine acetyltransferase